MLADAGKKTEGNHVHPASLKKSSMWRVPYMAILLNGWFIAENPIKINGLEVPKFQETSMRPLKNCDVFPCQARLLEDSQLKACLSFKRMAAMIFNIRSKN